MNAGKDAISLVTGNDKVISANPVIHPEMEKSLVKYPDAIDIPAIHKQSVSATTTSPATATPAAAKPSARKRQLSQTPQARPCSSAW